MDCDNLNHEQNNLPRFDISTELPYCPCKFMTYSIVVGHCKVSSNIAPLARGDAETWGPHIPDVTSAAFFCKATLTVLPAGTPVEHIPSTSAWAAWASTRRSGARRGCPVRVSFYLKGRDGERVEHVLGRVAYVRADESDNRIGIEFQETLRESAQPELMRRLLSL